jgi:methyl-accepting chemotaxis protein
MRFFTDLRIGIRLTTAFCVILGLMCLIVVTGIVYFDGIAAGRTAVGTARAVFIALSFLTILVGGGLSKTITRSIIIPIARSSAHIDLMAKGDFSIPVSVHALKRKDEMGVFAKSIDAMNRNLGRMLAEVASSATSISAASNRLSTSASQVSKGATQQAEKTTQVASGSAEMNQVAQIIAMSASKVASSANDAVKTANGSRDVVTGAITKVKAIADTMDLTAGFVKDLGKQSERIGDIVTAINEIADQTNLLALNAAIEAARAGDHGRGFAVVAAEVKKLAERTSASTKEIAEMITTIRMGVQKTVESMDMANSNVVAGVELSYRTSTSLENIIMGITTLHSGIHQIATATEEMTSTSEEMENDISQVSNISRETLSSSGEMFEAAESLLIVSQDLEAAVQTFRIG